MTSPPSGEQMRPSVATRGGATSASWPAHSGKTRSSTPNAPGPEIRTTAMAPTPGAVESAAMVSTSTASRPLLALESERRFALHLLALVVDPDLLRDRREVRGRVVEVQSAREVQEDEQHHARHDPHHHLHLRIRLVEGPHADPLHEEHRHGQEHGQNVERILGGEVREPEELHAAQLNGVLEHEEERDEHGPRQEHRET